MKTALLLLGNRLGNVLLGILTTTILANLMPGEVFGQYSYALSLIAIATIPAQMGLKRVVFREVSRFSAASDHGQARQVLNWASGFVVLSSLLLMSLALAFQALGFLNLPRSLLIPSMLMIPAISLLSLQAAALRGFGHTVASQIPESIAKPGMFLVFLALAYFSNREINSAHFSLWLNLTATGGAAILAILLIRFFGCTQTSRPRRFGFVRLDWLKATFILGLASGLQLLNAHVDIVMLGQLKGYEDVAIYRVMSLFGSQLSIAVQVTNLMISPYVARYVEKHEMRSLQQVLTFASMITSLLALIGIGILALVGRDLIGLLFAPIYVTGFPTMMLIAATQLINTLSGSPVLVLNLARMDKEVFTGLLLSTIVNIVMNAVLIPRFGMIGAAVASLLSVCVWNVYLVYQANIQLGVKTTFILGLMRRTS